MFNRLFIAIRSERQSIFRRFISVSEPANRPKGDAKSAGELPAPKPSVRPVTPEQKAAQPSRPSPAPAAKPAARNPQLVNVPQMAGTTRVRRRHRGILLSFFVLVLAPIAAAAYYLFFVAVDQYESRVGFAVRTEETKSALDVLGGLTGLSSASSSDPDILYEFIRSQEMVERVNAQLDLRDAFTAPEFDPVFALKDDSSIEELVAYWPRMIRVYYGGSGLIEVRAFAFDRDTAHRLAELVFEESSSKINAMSAVARNDATRYAAEERDKAIGRLIAARQALTTFRIENQIVDPEADIAGQMGLLNALQAQLAAELIERDKLLQTSRESDPRREQSALTIEVIERRIAEERRKLGVGDSNGSGESTQGYASVIGKYEELLVDQTFAEQSYLSALSAYDAALAEAQRTSRYLTAYLRPTMPETSTAPRRVVLIALLAGFILVTWFIMLLIYYSLRDRR